VWQALDVLVRDPHDTDAMTTLDAMRTQYDQLHSHAVALTQDHTNSEVQAARRQARRRMAKSLQQAAPQPTPSLPRRIVRKVRAVRGAR
jgi:hypothetical protein